MGSIDTLEVLMFGNGSGNGLTGTAALPTGQREFFFDNLLLDNPPTFAVGDYNRDGTVNAADYVIWRRTLNQAVPNGEGADGNWDGVVTQTDFDLWRQNFGTSISGDVVVDAAIPVPEPSTASFLWIITFATITVFPLRLAKHER
jgi:hypothetical protein